MADVIRETTRAERMTWGDCSVCHAKHGEPCNPDFGIPLGRTVNGGIPTEGVHVARIREAPMRVRISPL